MIPPFQYSSIKKARTCLRARPSGVPIVSPRQVCSGEFHCTLQLTTTALPRTLTFGNYGSPLPKQPALHPVSLYLGDESARQEELELGAKDVMLSGKANARNGWWWRVALVGAEVRLTP